MNAIATTLSRTRAAVGLGHGVPNVAAGVPIEAAQRIARIRARRTTESSVAGGHAADWNAAAAAAEEVRAGLRPAEVATSRELHDLYERVRIASEKSAEAEDVARAIATLAKAVEPIAAGKRAVSSAPRVEPYGAAEFKAARERLATLNSERFEVGDAPIGIEEAKAAARQQIDRLAAQGRPNVSGTVSTGKEFALHELGLGHNANGSRMFVPDGVALLAWAMRDQLVAAIEAEIDRQADPSAALSTEQRTERLAAIEAEADTIERREVATIWAGGDLTLFRPETDPARLLGVAYVENDDD